MASLDQVIRYVYDLRDNITAKLKVITGALRDNAAASNTTANAAEKGAKRQADAYRNAADSAGKLKLALGAVAAFVGFDKVVDGIKAVVDTGERLDDLRKEFDQVFGSVEKGGAALERIRAIAEKAPQPFEDIAAAAVRMRQVGLDPLDGSLQALIDNQNALNQSQEQLLGTIDALGKANVRGEVSLKSLVSLTENGVPVFDLLGKAMGTSSEAVRQLAEDGKLGSDSIKLIVAELGKLRAGVAADELGDTDAQLQKLKDTANQFLNAIAHSGVLDTFREELKNLNDQVQDAAKDGRLQSLAKSISEGIVGTAKAIAGAVKFVYDYAGALAALGKAYIIFRGLNIAGAMLAAAAATQTAAAASKAAAAEAAASNTAFGGLGKTLKSLPTQLKIGVAAIGIEILLDSVLKITSALREEAAIRDGIRDQIEQNIGAQSRLAAGIASVKAAYSQFAGVAIQSGDELRKQGVDQLRIYEEQLEGARKFYNALAVEAQAAGDKLAFDAAQSKLADVEKTLALVEERLRATGEAGAQATSAMSDEAVKLAATLRGVSEDAKSAGKVIGEAFEGFDFTSGVQEIGDFAQAFDSVAEKGGKAAKVLDETLLESLRKLSGQELLQFQSAATAAIETVGDQATETSAVLKATLEAGLERLGVKAADTGEKITKAGADTIATFTAVAENAQATSQAITAAFEAALKGVSTTDEAEALGDALEAAANRGVVSMKELAAATKDLDERIRTITANVSPLGSQFELLGIKSQAQLEAVRDNAQEAFQAIRDGAREGTAAQEDVVRAFMAYAEAARAAAADSSAEAKQRVEDQLAVQAAVLGIEDALKKAGDAGEKAGKQTADAYEEATQAIDETGRAIDDAGDAARGAAEGQESYTTALQGSQSAMEGIIAAGPEQAAALKELNQLLAQDAALTNVGLKQAQNLLETLGPLAGGAAALLERRISELQQAAQRAADTARRMADEAADLQDQIDEIQGNDENIENRRHAKKLADLEAEAKANGKFNSAEYQELVALENKLHELKLQNIRKEKGEGSAPTGAGGLPGKGGRGGGSGGGGSGAGDSPAVPAPEDEPPRQPARPGAGGKRPFSPQISVVLLSGDARAREDLARIIKKELSKIDD